MGLKTIKRTIIPADSMTISENSAIAVGTPEEQDAKSKGKRITFNDMAQ